jgi:branched-chain amino acid transport system substrate-binding protein
VPPPATIPTAQLPASTKAAEGPLTSPFDINRPGGVGGDPVALLLPLTGRASVLGQALLDAAQMALFEIGDEGFTFLVYDTQGTAAGAEDAARLAISDGAAFILGPLFGQSAQAVKPIAATVGVNVVSFSNNDAVSGEGVNVFGLLPDEQIHRIIAHAAAERHSRIGLLAPVGIYGDRVTDAAIVAAQQAGLEITKVGRYELGEDLSDTIRVFAEYNSRRSSLAYQRKQLAGRSDEIAKQTMRRLEGLETLGDPPYDALLVPEGGAAIRNIAPLLAFYDIDPKRVQLLGTAAWDDDASLGDEPALVGARYAAPSPILRHGFDQRFKQFFKYAPPRLASLAYDATLLAVSLRTAGETADFSAEALADAAGFAGVDGIFRFLANGQNQRGLAILEVRESGPEVLVAAPESFAGL